MRRPHRAADAQQGITLIELLVSIVVMGIISTMILLVWFTLQDSYASSEQNAIQRDDARQAVWRMAAEIRDAQGVDGSPPIISATADSIVIGTSFNNAGNTDQPTDPTATDTSVHPVRFAYDAASHTIFRTEDVGRDGFANDTPVVFLANVVNASVASSYDGTEYASTPVFRYSYYNNAGTLLTVNDLPTSVDTSQVLNVHIRVLVDIKPNRSPIYMDLQTTAQPRNAPR